MTVVLMLPIIGSVCVVESGIWRSVETQRSVITEIALVSLVHGAWLTALAFSIANAALLTVRVRAEERALGGDGDVAGEGEGQPDSRCDKQEHTAQYQNQPLGPASFPRRRPESRRREGRDALEDVSLRQTSESEVWRGVWDDFRNYLIGAA